MVINTGENVNAFYPSRKHEAILKLDMVGQTYNTSTWKIKAPGSEVQDQPGLHEKLSQKKKGRKGRGIEEVEEEEGEKKKSYIEILSHLG